MLDSTDIEPAFGQVWQYASTQMMLLYPGENRTWWSIALGGSNIILEWSGLDQPRLREDSTDRLAAPPYCWKLLSEAS